MRAGLYGKLAGCAIEGVTDDGVVEGRHVDADLVRASGFNAHADEGELAKAGCEAADHFVVRDGVAGVFGWSGGHAGAAEGVAADSGRNGSLLTLDVAVHERNVSLADLARGEEFGEGCVGLVVFGDDDEAAGFLVEAMDDAGAKLAAGG